MRDTTHFKKHLSVVTYLDDKQIGNVPCEDPFHTTNVHIVTSFWERLRNLFTREIVVRVHIRSDGVAWGRWFQGADICEKCKVTKLVGHPTDPGYHHEDERWCEKCYYGIEEPSVASHAENSSN